MNTPSPDPLPLKGREGLFFLSPLPEGKGWVRALFLFSFWFPACAGIMDIATPTLSQIRVIARRIAPKQPRGTSPHDRVCLPGCFALLAMTRLIGLYRSKLITTGT
ncbi:MAG: hypothetical protein RJA87_1672 [Pseudomonadota bacterium]|jgi:hypothetical protein